MGAPSILQSSWRERERWIHSCPNRENMDACTVSTMMMMTMFVCSSIPFTAIQHSDGHAHMNRRVRAKFAQCFLVLIPILVVQVIVLMVSQSAWMGSPVTLVAVVVGYARFPWCMHGFSTGQSPWCKVKGCLGAPSLSPSLSPSLRLATFDLARNLVEDGASALLDCTWSIHWLA